MRRAGATSAVIAVLALSSCGGNSPATNPGATTPATTSTSSGPATLDPTQLDRVNRTTQHLLSATTLFLSAVNRCTASKRRTHCINRAVKPAEAVVKSTRDKVRALVHAVSGDCAAQLSAVAEKLVGVTDDLGPYTLAIQKRDPAITNRLGPDIQTQLRAFAAASTMSQKACTKGAVP